MEPLFTAKSQFTWEECWQMTKTALLRRRHTALAVVALVLLCVLFSAMAGTRTPCCCASCSSRSTCWSCGSTRAGPSWPTA